MSLSILTTFWLVSLLLVITPGVDWSYTISAGIHGKVVIPAVAGLLLGHLAATCLVAAGIGALLSDTPLALTLLTVAGAGYLLWLGIGLIRRPATPVTALSDTPDNARQWLLKGIGVSALNPSCSCFSWRCSPSFPIRTAPGHCRCKC
ncbi:MAG: LysE family transporter [Porticoccaceae bacterium]